MRRLLLFFALASVPAAVAAQESPLEPDESRADLDELLRLPGRYWPAAAGASATIERAFTRYDLEPELGGVVTGSGFGLGVRQHLRRDERSALGWSALATYSGYTELDLFYRRELDGRGRVAWKTDLRHRILADERFFGLGLSSDAAERSDFRLDETALRTQLGVELPGGLSLHLGGDVRRLSASYEPTGAFASGVFARDPRAFQTASAALGLAWDTRDVPGYARRGSFVGGEVRQFVGLGAASPSFRRVSLELQNVLPLPGPDHALATRLRADLLDHAPGVQLPFFWTQGLGGSHSLRSFSRDRFRGYDRLFATVEYRYRLIPGKLDAVGFWDTGGVYESLGELELEGLHHSFGGGLRLLRNGNVLLRLELAHGAEGARFLVSFSAPF